MGNVISPSEIIDKYGAEILRLWVTYEDYRDDIKISKEIVDRIIETYRRIRNTFRFLHANISDFDPEKERVPYGQLSSLDKWLLSRLQRVIERVREAYEAYAFHTIYHTIHNFCAVDLSALYLDIIKDRMYVERKDSVKRKASQTVVFESLVSLARLAAPILAFTTEEMWSYLRPLVPEESVHLAALPEVNPAFLNPEIEAEWETIWRIREAVNKKIEEKRVQKMIGHPLDTKVVITASLTRHANLRKLGDELKEVLIVSQAEVVGRGRAADHGAEGGRSQVRAVLAVLNGRGDRRDLSEYLQAMQRYAHLFIIPPIFFLDRWTKFLVRRDLPAGGRIPRLFLAVDSALAEQRRRLRAHVAERVGPLYISFDPDSHYRGSRVLSRCRPGVRLDQVCPRLRAFGRLGQHVRQDL